MKAHFEMFARCDASANAQVDAAAGRLGEAEAYADPGAAFGTTQGTPNHVTVADLTWLARCRRQRPPLHAPDCLLHCDHDALAVAHRVPDADIGHFGAGLDAVVPVRKMSHTRVANPMVLRQKLAPAHAHPSDHQTHHRGQVRAMPTRLNSAATALDLLYFHREAG